MIIQHTFSFAQHPNTCRPWDPDSVQMMLMSLGCLRLRNMNTTMRCRFWKVDLPKEVSAFRDKNAKRSFGLETYSYTVYRDETGVLETDGVRNILIRAFPYSLPEVFSHRVMSFRLIQFQPNRGVFIY